MQNDLATLQADGVSAPSGAGAAISSARSAISSAIKQANAAIGQVAADASTGYQIANSLATGACAGGGPGSPPAPPANLS